MTTLAYHQLPPNALDAEMARLSGQQLARLAAKNRPVRLLVVTAEQEQPIELPAAAVAMLTDILTSMAAGRSVTLMLENTELTTVQAAEVLNVSHPFLIKLLDEGAIAYRKVGAQRRVRLEEVVAYKTRIDQESELILDQLVADAQEHDMGYGLPNAFGGETTEEFKQAVTRFMQKHDAVLEGLAR